jgi:hypothetical protein
MTIPKAVPRPSRTGSAGAGTASRPSVKVGHAASRERRPRPSRRSSRGRRPSPCPGADPGRVGRMPNREVHSDGNGYAGRALKTLRTAELAEYARRVAAEGAAMKARHAFQIEGEKAARALLSQQIGKAWEQHKAAYGPPRTAEIRPERKPDRIGGSRDRERQGRQQGTAEEEREAKRRENLPDRKNDPGRTI